MDRQSDQNSSDQRTQKLEDRSKNIVLEDEHKHKSEAGPESSSSREIDDEIIQLQQRLHQQTEKKQSYLRKIYELVRRSRDGAK